MRAIPASLYLRRWSYIKLGFPCRCLICVLFSHPSAPGASLLCQIHRRKSILPRRFQERGESGIGPTRSAVCQPLEWRGTGLVVVAYQTVASRDGTIRPLYDTASWPYGSFEGANASHYPHRHELLHVPLRSTT